jgi:hypothetical protein
LSSDHPDWYFSSIIIGESPFGATAPGRGIVFVLVTPEPYELYAKFLCSFSPYFSPNDNFLDIRYEREHLLYGGNTSFAATLDPFLRAITNKSPYRVTVDDPVKPGIIRLTSVVDMGFYFDAAY